jgi:hypothetical protein
LMVTATILFGDFLYGRDETSGYSSGPLQVDPAVLDTGGYCAQPSYAKLYVGEFSTRIVRGVPVYPIGIGKAFSRMRFRFFNATNHLVTEHTTHAADRGCVVRQERERFSSSVLPAGRYRVEVTFVPYESNQLETRTLWLETIEYTGNTWCSQSSHPIVLIDGGGPARVGGLVYLSGIVRPSTPITFTLLNAAGSIVLTHTTRPAANNCVVAHEREKLYLQVPPGSYTLRATYKEWETNRLYTADRDLVVLSNTYSPAPATPITQPSMASIPTPLTVQSANVPITTAATPSLPVGITASGTKPPLTTPPSETTPPTTTPPITATPSETKAPPTTGTPPVTKVSPTMSTPTTTSTTTVPATKTTILPSIKPNPLAKPVQRAPESLIPAETETVETIESKA